MRTTTVTRFLPLSLLSLLLAVAGCGSKPAATPESSNSASPSSPSGSNSASNGASTNAPAATSPAAHCDTRGHHNHRDLGSNREFTNRQQWRSICRVAGGSSNQRDMGCFTSWNQSRRNGRNCSIRWKVQRQRATSARDRFGPHRWNALSDADQRNRRRRQKPREENCSRSGRRRGFRRDPWSGGRRRKGRGDRRVGRRWCGYCGRRLHRQERYRVARRDPASFQTGSAAFGSGSRRSGAGCAASNQLAQCQPSFF